MQKNNPSVHRKAGLEEEPRFHEPEEVLKTPDPLILLEKWQEEKSTADSLMVDEAIRQLIEDGRDSEAKPFQKILAAHLRKNGLASPGETLQFLQELR